MKPAGLALSAILLAAVISGFTVLSSSRASAADGSGTNTVSPTEVAPSTTGNTLTFTFTAAETMNSGGLLISVPSGWSAPQGTSGTAGYTTVSSAGVTARAEDAADSTTGWSAGSACSSGLALDSTIKHEGSASILCSNGNETSGDRFYKNISAENWSSFTTVGFWIFSTMSIANNRLQFAYDDNANLASPIDQIAFGSAISANTWTYVTISLTGTRTSVASFGFIINHSSSLDGSVINIDDILIGPSAPTFSGNDIGVRFLSLASTQTATVIYGDGGGASGVTAPGISGTNIFTTQTRASDSGILTDIAVQPTVEVVSASATKFVIDNPTDGTVDAPITVTVRALRSNNSPATNYQNDVTLVTSGSATGAGLVDIVNGVGTINISDTVAETVNLSLSDTQTTGLDVSSTQDVIFAHGALSKFTLNDPGNITAGSRAAYTVSRRDQYNNLITTGSTTVYLYSTSTGPKVFYDAATGGNIITSVTISGGSSSADFWYYDELAGTWTITASDNISAPDGSAGVDDATDSIIVSPGATASFALNDPGDITAGNRAAYTVSRRDQFNNLVTSGSTVVYLYSTSTGPKVFYDAATGGNIITSVTISGGSSSANFWYYDELAGTWAVTASDNATVPDGTTGVDDATDSIMVNAAAVSKLTLNDPGGIVAGNRAGYVVSRKDVFNNLVTSGSTTVYLYSTSTGPKAFYDAATGGNIITSVTISGGSSSANFWYYDELAGTWTITASDNATAPDGLSGLDDATDSIVVSPGATASFALNDPGGIVAGNRAAYAVSRKDAFNNSVTSGSDAVYLYSSSTGPKAFYDAATGGNIITSVTISGGSSSANFWYYDEADGTWTITASDNATTPDGATGIDDATDSIIVSPPAVTATRFTIVEPTDTTVDSAAMITVRAENNSGVLDISYQSDVTLVASGSATGDGLVDIINGIGTLNISDTVAETVILTLSDTQSTGLDVSSTKDIVFSPGATASFALNDPGDITAGNRAAYTITKKDQFGNTTASGSITAYLYSSSTGPKVFYDAATAGNVITSVTISGGSSSANFWYYDELAGTWAVTASDNATVPDGTTGVDDATDLIAINPAAISKFTLNDPGNITAGNRAAYTVSRRDQFNNLVTSGSTIVYLYSSSTGPKIFYDAASGGNIITFVTISDGSSSANFWYYDELAGTWTITASDNATAPDGTTSIDDATDSIIVSPSATASFSLSDPGDITAGTDRAGYVVSRKDAFNNSVTSGSDIVYLYSTSTGPKAFYDAATGGNIITSVTISGGSSSANFWYYDELAGTWTITVSDNATAPDGATGIDDATDSIIVSPAAVVATKFVIVNPTDGTVDSPITVTIRAEDNAGSLDASYQSDVTLVASGSTTGAGLVDIINGVGTLNISDTVAETVTLTLSDTQSTGLNVSSTQDAVFSPGATASFALNDPGDITAGNRAAYTITKKDQFGNTTASGSITAYLYSSSTGPKVFYDAATGGSQITSVVIGSGSSSANFWYYDELVGGWTITVSDNSSSPDGATGIDDATDLIAVNPAAVSRFEINNPGDMAAGTRLGYTVSRKDAFNNLVTSGSTTVYLYSTSTGPKAFYDAPEAGNQISSVVISEATSSANFWYYDERAGSWSVTVSDNLSAPDGETGIDDATDSIVVSPAAVGKYLLNNPGDMTVGTRLGYSVSREDSFGNSTVSGSDTVYLYSTSTGPYAFYNAATAGNIITFVTISDGSSSANFWYYDEADGAWAVTASDNPSNPNGETGIDDATDPVVVSSAPIVATRFTILEPSDATVGSSVTVTVRAEDDSGNVDVSYQSDVTLVASGSTTGAGLVDIINGVGTLNISDTVAETVTLTLSDTQSTGLNVSSSRDIAFRTLPSLRLFVPAPPPALGSVRFIGRSFPGARIVITSSADGSAPIKREYTSPPSGSFDISFSGFSPGERSFALTAYDRDGSVVQTRIFNLAPPPGEPVIVRGINIPPTIKMLRSSVPGGTNAVATGYAIPGGTIEPIVDGEFFREAYSTVDASGNYRLSIGTISLDFGNHSISVRETGVGTAAPLTSATRTFTVSRLFTPKTDLNQDDRIDISDWSIFISKWSARDDPARAEELDFNGDGVVDIADFSIFVRTIKR